MQPSDKLILIMGSIAGAIVLNVAGNLLTGPIRRMLARAGIEAVSMTRRSALKRARSIVVGVEQCAEVMQGGDVRTFREMTRWSVNRLHRTIGRRIALVMTAVGSLTGLCLFMIMYTHDPASSTAIDRSDLMTYPIIIMALMIISMISLTLYYILNLSGSDDLLTPYPAPQPENVYANVVQETSGAPLFATSARHLTEILDVMARRFRRVVERSTTDATERDALNGRFNSAASAIVAAYHRQYVAGPNHAPDAGE